MKNSNMVVVCLALTLAGAQAQNAGTPGGGSQSNVTATPLPAPTSYQVVDREANYNIWERQTFELGLNGMVITNFHQFTELSSGMNYWNNGQWMESQDLVEPFSSGSISQQGQFQV